MRMRMISWFGPATTYSTDTGLSNLKHRGNAPSSTNPPLNQDCRRASTLPHRPQPSQSEKKPNKSTKIYQPALHDALSAPTWPLPGGIEPREAGGNDAIPPDEHFRKDRPRQPSVAIAGHGRHCGIEEENVRMGECGVNTPPPSHARNGAFLAIFSSKTCFPRTSRRRGAPAPARPPRFSRGIDRVSARFPPFQEPTGRLPASSHAFLDWVEWCGESLVESG